MPSLRAVDGAGVEEDGTLVNVTKLLPPSIALSAIGMALIFVASLLLRVGFDHMAGLAIGFALGTFSIETLMLWTTGVWAQACGFYIFGALFFFSFFAAMRLAEGMFDPNAQTPMEDCVPGGYEHFRWKVYYFFEVPEAHFISLVSVLWLIWLVFWSCLVFTMQSCAEFDNDVHPEFSPFYFWNEAVISVIFTIEYLLRFWANRNRCAFLFSFVNILDVCAFLPFYLNPFLGTHIRSSGLRVLRILQLVRLVKSSRYSPIVQVIARASAKSADALLLLAALVVVGVFILSSLLWISEAKVWDEDRNCWTLKYQKQMLSGPGCLPYQSIVDSFYYSITTMTTVGYGDMVPASDNSRYVACLGMFMGVLVIAMPVSILSGEFQIVSNIVKSEERLMLASDSMKPEVVSDMGLLIKKAKSSVAAAKATVIKLFSDIEGQKAASVLESIMDGLDTDVCNNLDQVIQIMLKTITPMPNGAGPSHPGSPRSRPDSQRPTPTPMPK